MQLVAHEPVVLAPLLAPTVFSNFNGLHSFTPRQHQHLSLVRSRLDSALKRNTYSIPCR